MTFGVSVAAYNKKPTVAFKPANPANLAIEQNKATTATPTQPVTPVKTALAGSTAPVASGLVNNVQSPIYQPLFSGNMGDKSNSIYGRLDAINQTTQSLDEYTQAKVNAANSRINNFNRRLTSAQQAPGTQDFFGDGSGTGLDSEQVKNAQLIANVGRQRGVDDAGIKIALMTALTESGLRNLNHGDRDSVGLFQQRTSQGWGSIQQIMDPNYSAGKFYDTLKGTNYKAMNPWQAAQAVQRSFDPTGNNYRVQYDLAQRAYNSIMTPQSGPNNAAGWINAHNNKYLDYDGYYGAQCVDLYNYYVKGFAGGNPPMVGMAPEIYNNFDTKVFHRLPSNTMGHMGDVAVFRPGGMTRDGHVAIVVGDNGNGTLRVLQANATAAGSAGNTIISNISKQTLMGYLRPNRLGN